MHWSDDKHEISWDTHHIHETEPHEYLQVALIFSTPWKNLPFWRKRGNPRCVFWEAQNASGRQADILTLPDGFSQKSKCTEVWIG